MALATPTYILKRFSSTKICNRHTNPKKHVGTNLFLKPARPNNMGKLDRDSVLERLLWLERGNGPQIWVDKRVDVANLPFHSVWEHVIGLNPPIDPPLLPRIPEFPLPGSLPQFPLVPSIATQSNYAKLVFIGVAFYFKVCIDRNLQGMECVHLFNPNCPETDGSHCLRMDVTWDDVSVGWMSYVVLRRGCSNWAGRVRHCWGGDKSWKCHVGCGLEQGCPC